ncbi:hypothetical protein [Nocardioides nanhaiensis]|uniref:Uncharacterized protein n=1 Tax=Nocardioides nanhaiensis TaxID=1476871 RepID=A0ABP8WZA7_9ACTN
MTTTTPPLVRLGTDLRSQKDRQGHEQYYEVALFFEKRRPARYWVQFPGQDPQPAFDTSARDPQPVPLGRVQGRGFRSGNHTAGKSDRDQVLHRFASSTTHAGRPSMSRPQASAHANTQLD